MNDDASTPGPVGSPVDRGVRPCAWVDERAISWLEARAGKAGAYITTPLAAKGPSHERPMPLYTVAALQAALAAALDCRTCTRYTLHHRADVPHCLSPIRCVDGSRYERADYVQLWETTPADAGF